METDTPQMPAEVFLVADFDATAVRLDAVLAAAALTNAPTVLLRIDDTCTATVPEIANAVARLQERGIAVLIEDNASLARETKADGCHISWHDDVIEHYKVAREMSGEDYIVGADAGRSRHCAMQLGEKDAAYIAFGIPAHVTDRDTARARQADLLSWWSEIFEVPCVAFNVADGAHAAAAASVGADFIALDLPDDIMGGAVSDWFVDYAPAFAAAARAA